MLKDTEYPMVLGRKKVFQLHNFFLLNIGTAENKNMILEKYGFLGYFSYNKKLLLSEHDCF